MGCPFVVSTSRATNLSWLSMIAITLINGHMMLLGLLLFEHRQNAFSDMFLKDLTVCASIVVFAGQNLGVSTPWTPASTFVDGLATWELAGWSLRGFCVLRVAYRSVDYWSGLSGRCISAPLLPKVCLVRLKQKYGIRVRKQDEALAWTKL